MTPRERLLRAKARIDKGWTQHLYAVRAPYDPNAVLNENARSVGVSSRSDEAIAWCLIGALGGDMPSEVTDDSYFPTEHAVEACIRDQTAGGYQNIVPFNDTEGRTKEEIISVLDCALDAFPA